MIEDLIQRLRQPNRWLASLARSPKPFEDTAPFEAAEYIERHTISQVSRVIRLELLNEAIKTYAAYLDTLHITEAERVVARLKVIECQRMIAELNKEEQKVPLIESQDAAAYTPNGSPQEHCSICDHWRATGTGETGACRIVTGRIAAEGWCRHFTHVSEAAE